MRPGLNVMLMSYAVKGQYLCIVCDQVVYCGCNVQGFPFRFISCYLLVCLRLPRMNYNVFHVSYLDYSNKGHSYIVR